MRSPLECALTYASWGWEVFPCHRLSKIPIPKNGFHGATTDLAEINEYWLANPDANVAIHIPDDHVVVDIDDRQLLDDLGTFPETVKAKTPRSGDGLHIWYRIPKDVTLHRSLSMVQGLDILTNAGYVIAPNSMHPRGIRYKWINPPDPTREFLGIEEAPDWLVKMCTDAHPSEALSPKLDMENVLYNLKEGHRQEKLFQAACSMRGRNIRYEEALALLEMAAANASPPYTEQPIKKILDRVYSKYPINQVKENARKIWQIGELVSQDVGDIAYYIDTILPQGFTLFSADPKMGKSMIVANIAKALVTGRKALGKFEVKQCGVLYLDMEQGEVTAQKRWREIIGDDKIPDELYTSFEWNKMDLGGMDQLEEFLNRNPIVKVIVIDVLANFWPSKDLVDGTAYQKDYAVIRKLADLARKYSIAIIGIHHNVKNSQAKDFIKAASGSMGMTAASDTIWALDRARNNDYAQLKVTGKNIAESVVYLQCYNDGFSWFAT